MLLEKTAYLDDFPMDIKIMRITEYPLHYHKDIEFIYVLKGKVNLKNCCHNYLLCEGDIFTNSAHEIHGLTACGEDNIVAVIKVSNRFFSRYFPDLIKGCFMSYVKEDKTLLLDPLRKMLLQILLDYLGKSFHYKNTCIEQMIEVIEYLNCYFNLFAFEGKTVVNFKNDNPVAVKRLSRIINYVYANHAGRISLADLADREHLSTFYISHLIRDYMGISFKELLSFARIEMSEILLLETDRKISTIARDVGFSATSYYEKAFRQWFLYSPEEYRRMFTSRILSAKRPPRLELLNVNQAISLVRRCISEVSYQEKNNARVNRLDLSVDVDPAAAPLWPVRSAIDASVTLEDYHVMGESLFSLLNELNISRVSLHCSCEGANTEAALLVNRMNFMGYQASLGYESGLCGDVSAGYDTIARAIQIVSAHFTSGEKNPHCSLRDQGGLFRILKGSPSLITSCLIPKPSFYAYRLLHNISGNLIGRGKYYYIVKSEDDDHADFQLVVLNFNHHIENLCQQNLNIHEASRMIASFQDELRIGFTIPAEPGQYVIAEYELSNTASVFDYVENLGFADKVPLPLGFMQSLNTGPRSRVSRETINDKIVINIVMKGAGIHVAAVKRVDSEG